MSKQPSFTEFALLLFACVLLIGKAAFWITILMAAIKILQT